MRAVAGERLGDRRTDAARGAGDEDDLALERSHEVDAADGSPALPMRTTWPLTYAGAGREQEASVVNSWSSAPGAT